MIEVVCGIIYHKKKVLLCRRNSQKHMGGFWEFPGGKIEKYEMPKEALKRELAEELEIEIEECEYFDSSIHSYDNFTIRLTAFECKFIESAFKLSVHDMFEWIEVEDLLQKKLVPADIPIVEKLLRKR